MDRDSLAKTLRELRAERGISLARLARETDISSSFLSLLEQGRSDVTISRLVRLAEVYDVEMTDLLAGSRKRPSGNIRLLRASPENLIRFEEEGVEMYDLTAGVRWAMVVAVSVYEPRGAVLVSDLHEREAMFFALRGHFEVSLKGEPPIEIEKGAGVSLRSAHPYTLRNLTAGEGRLLSVGMHPQPR
jgi:transcriptional regulator with XRE-family HTH domain